VLKPAAQTFSSLSIQRTGALVGHRDGNPRFVAAHQPLRQKSHWGPNCQWSHKNWLLANVDEVGKTIYLAGATPVLSSRHDYVVTKIPRFTFEKFGRCRQNPILGTAMKSVAKVMGRFAAPQESLAKGAAAAWKTGRPGLNEVMRFRARPGRMDKNAIRRSSLVHNTGPVCWKAGTSHAPPPQRWTRFLPACQIETMVFSV